MLGKPDGRWPLGYQNIKQKDSQVGQHFVDCSGSTNDLVWKILDACRTVETLMAIEPI